jgi:hypothetical protein
VVRQGEIAAAWSGGAASLGKLKGKRVMGRVGVPSELAWLGQLRQGGGCGLGQLGQEGFWLKGS